MPFDLCHVYRKGNRVADGLANIGAAGSDVSFVSVSVLPKPVIGLLVLDNGLYSDMLI